MNVERFVKLMTGHFDNKEQFTEMKEAGKIFPYAQHVNTVCNDKIKNIPEDFTGIFIVEESYYETDGRRHASPHLFLITDSDNGIILSSYEIPEGEDKNTFSYHSMKIVEYSELKKSEKFTPAIYQEKDGVWEGGSVSQFTPVMYSGCGRSFLTLVWRYPKVWKSMEREHLDMMCRLDIKG